MPSASGASPSGGTTLAVGNPYLTSQMLTVDDLAGHAERASQQAFCGGDIAVHHRGADARGRDDLLTVGQTGHGDHAKSERGADLGEALDCPDAVFAQRELLADP